MHCTSCGTALVEGAVFCKRCGTAAAAVMLRGTSAAGGPPDKLAEVAITLSVAMGAVGLGGLIAVFLFVYKLFLHGVAAGAAAFLALAGLAAVFGLTLLLGRQASRVLDTYLRPYGGQDAQTQQTSPDAAPRDTAQLEAPREPTSSVTDHTTRTFDSVHAENARRR